MRACAFIFALICWSQAIGQVTPELIDEFGKISCEETKARVDGLMSKVNEQPGSRAVISINAAEGKLLQSLVFEEMLRGALVMRKYDGSLVQFRRSSPSREISVRVWLVQPGSQLPPDEASRWSLTIGRNQPSFIVGSEWFYEDDICPPVDGTRILAEFLNANSGSHANIVARPGSRFRTKRGRESFLKEMRSKYGIDAKRFRVYFTARIGPRSTTEEPDTELWFVP